MRILEHAVNRMLLRYAFPSTAKVYAAYCKSKKIEPVSVSMPNGTQAHWVGSKNARNVLIYYHGKNRWIP